MVRNFKSWRIRKASRIFLSIVLGISIIVKILLYILNKNYDIYFFMKGFHQKNFEYYLDVIILVTLAGIIFSYVRKILAKVIVILIAIMIFCYINFSFGFSYTYPEYFYFTSPDNSMTLIVEENSWSLGGWSNFYVMKNELFIKDLKTSISTDDGHRPFTNEDYTLLWINNNTVKISYGYGQGDIIKTEIIKLN